MNDIINCQGKKFYKIARVANPGETILIVSDKNFKGVTAGPHKLPIGYVGVVDNRTDIIGGISVRNWGVSHKDYLVLEPIEEATQ